MQNVKLLVGGIGLFLYFSGVNSQESDHEKYLDKQDKMKKKTNNNNNKQTKNLQIKLNNK